MKIIINGYGEMGKILKETAEKYGDIEIAEICDPDKNMPPLMDANADFDVLIDFSTAEALEDIIKFCEKYKKPAVLAVTGYTVEQEKKIFGLSHKIPVFRTKNLSVGINIMEKLIKTASKMHNWDAEIIEKHHNKKKDMPSGTALMLRQACGKDIPIHSVRLGTIAGEHTIIYAGEDEILEIKHTALSKRVFAEGAIRAARYIFMAKPGFYTMNDIL